jgi:D-alanyl-D-alanine-carboxypeptidase/D-alanyl-D-alanine-endopeptidase
MIFKPKCFALLPTLAALATIPMPQLRAQVTVPSDSVIRAILQNRIDTKRAVGIVAATLDHGRPRIYTAGSSGAPGVPLDGNTVFEIGSITKVFTASLLADMVARGEVKLDDPVAKYLPKSVRIPSRNGKQITLLDLSTQSSGLPRMPTNFTPADNNNPYADYTVAQMYAFLSSYELTRDIGAQYEYSNLGVGLLGHALALRGGKSYENLVTDRILRPLGMNDTRITLTPAMKSRLAPGHSEGGEVVANWDLPTLAGAGALRSTVNDMLKFLAANLDSTSAPLGRVLATTHFARRDVNGAQMRIGLNWHILTAFGLPVVWHNGGTGGYRTFIGFDQANNRGAIVLSNQSVSPDDIGFHLLDERAPLAPPASTKVRTEMAVDPAVLEAYVGVYQLAPTFAITVTREGSSLYAQATGQQRFQLFAETPTEFFLKVVDAQITFEKDSAGKVIRLILHQGGQNAPGVKQ